MSGPAATILTAEAAASTMVTSTISSDFSSNGQALPRAASPRLYGARGTTVVRLNAVLDPRRLPPAALGVRLAQSAVQGFPWRD